MPDVLRVVVAVPGLRVVNELNGTREHWAAVNRRRRDQKDLVRAHLAMLGRDAREAIAAAPGLRVRFARVGGRRMDSDGCSAAFKSVRDAVAGWVGRDDGDPWFAWVLPPAQESGPVGVRIELETLEAP